MTLARSGWERTRWVAGRMPLLREAAAAFTATRPFDGLVIGVSLHLEPKTAALLGALRQGGARIVAAGNHGSTQDDVVAYLQASGVDARGQRADPLEQHLEVVASILDEKPDILLDNGADLVAIAVRRRLRILGGTEETTSGHFRLSGELRDSVDFPVIVINDSPLKAIVENKHAVGQSIVESFQRITNLMPQGKRWTIVGYGWCGRGIAQYARALGARVSVAEIDEIKALEAAMDGFRVGQVADLMDTSDVVITATGRADVITATDLELAPSGVIVGNAGHFDTEIDVTGIRAVAREVDRFGQGIERYTLPHGKTVELIAEGRMMNLAGVAPKGNSIESMDLGFALQAHALERIASAAGSLPHGAQAIPGDIDRRLAASMVAHMMGRHPSSQTEARLLAPAIEASA